jgi:hypothetical protein
LFSGILKYPSKTPHYSPIGYTRGTPRVHLVSSMVYTRRVQPSATCTGRPWQVRQVTKPLCKLSKPCTRPSMPGGAKSICSSRQWYILGRMRYSRKILTLSAFVAVAVWANAQIMACCWYSEKAESMITRLETAAAPSIEVSSCCPGEKADVATSQNTERHSSVGCKQDAPPVEITVASTAAFPQILLATLSFSEIAPEDIPGPHSQSSILSSASGPPRYLTFQRILI